MGRYCLLQCKRIARFLPGALLAVIVLLGSLLSVFSALTSAGAAEDGARVKIAMVGTAGDSMVQMALSALKTYDSTQLSMEILEMEEAEAHTALERGDISAYIVIPDNFVEEAQDGHIIPMTYVSTTGAAGLTTILKDEFTEVISLLLLESQRGVYGMYDAMWEQSIGGRGKQMNALSLEYVEYILARDKLYNLQELGISDALGLEDYMLCGLFVLMLMICCLPFAPFMIRKDLSLDRMLTSRGRSAVAQILGDWGIYCGSMVLLSLPIPLLADLLYPGGLQGLGFGDMLPVIIMICSFSFLLYTLSSDMIGGVLTQFFSVLAMCFVSGCIYPVFFFPLSIQKLARWLPTGAARSYLASGMTGQSAGSALPVLLVYTLVFTGLALAVRLHRMKEARV